MQRPNLLILYTDQQRWDTLHANGNADIQTPNLDRLAAQSANFDHYFVQSPVCMPSRASFLTGQYPSTLRITHMGVPLPRDAVTLPRLLKGYGYRSANVGKLHFLPHANRDHREPHPDYGFDVLEISDEPGPYEDAYRAWMRRTQPHQLDFLSAGLPPNAARWYETMQVDDPVAHPTENATDGGGRFDFLRPIPFGGGDPFADDEATHTAFVAERTLDFLHRHVGASEPFLCISGFYSPHAPWIAPQRFLDLYDPATFALPTFPAAVEAERPPATDDDDAADELFSDAQLRAARHGYYAMVSEVDHHVGRILDYLDEAGLAEKTVVVFTSDHGEWLGEHLRYGKGYPAHDQASRVPLLVRVPDQNGRCMGQRFGDVVEAIDVVPTLLDAVGVQKPAHLQGESLFPLLAVDATGSVAQSGQRVSQRANQLALTEGNGWKSLRTADFRYLAHADGSESLFDLRQLHGDYHNVAAEAAYRNELTEHRRLLLERLLASERPLPRVWTY